MFREEVSKILCADGDVLDDRSTTAEMQRETAKKVFGMWRNIGPLFFAEMF